MRVIDIQQEFKKQLNGLYPLTEIQNFFFWTIEELLGLKRIDFSLNSSHSLNEKELAKIKSVLDRLKRQEPIQYIFGYTEFYGLRINVSPHVLIPRPETEELVDWVINDCKTKPLAKILDIGTGSGCIPISIKKHLQNHQVYGMDISEEALKIAYQNAEMNTADINFIKQDVLSLDCFPIDADVIISNPPYVKKSEQAQMAKNVLDYEPHLALFVEDKDPLMFYRKICELAKNNTKPIFVYFELNEFHKNHYLSMLDSLDVFAYQFREDFKGKTRMLKIEFR